MSRGDGFWLLVSAVAAALALGTYRRRIRLPRPDSGPAGGSLPPLSVVVPARNEGPNLRRLLPSLRAQVYPGRLEVLVVSDGSTDDTEGTARAFGARVLRVSGPPPGWLGKPYAAHRGALAAGGEWLLFTDADTLHRPGTAAGAVAFALRLGLDALSLLPRAETGSAPEAAALAVALAGLFAGSSRPESLANGQFLLVRREAYLAAGGFEAVRAEILEDVALGRRLRAAGYRHLLADGRTLVSVRAAPGFGGLLAALARWTLALGPDGPGLLAAALTAGLAAPLGLLLRHPGMGLLGWGLAAVGLLPWTRELGRPGAALLAPLGALAVVGSALWGRAAVTLGSGVLWKGRRVR